MREVKFGKTYEEIKVNENGDTIKIPVGDNAFKDKFFDIIKFFDGMQQEINSRYSELSKEIEDEAKLRRIDYELEDEYTQKVCAMIDGLFEKNTMKKCYPEAEKPNLLMVADFFGNIAPEIADIYGERQKNIDSMYNRNRKGARSRK